MDCRLDKEPLSAGSCTEMRSVDFPADSTAVEYPSSLSLLHGTLCSAQNVYEADVDRHWRPIGRDPGSTSERGSPHVQLRIPPYHCEFNPTELIWAEVKAPAVM